MPRSIIDKQLALGRQRVTMCDIFYRLEESARKDYCPWMSDAEFADAVVIILRIAQRHISGRLPTESELARSTGIPRNTLRRKLKAFAAHGMIEKDGHRLALHAAYFNQPHMIAGFRRRLKMLRDMSGQILETVDWETLVKSDRRSDHSAHPVAPDFHHRTRRVRTGRQDNP